eukprot:2424472-Rhodomonas_salina.1
MAFKESRLQNPSAPPEPRPSGAAEAKMQSNWSHLRVPCRPQHTRFGLALSHTRFGLVPVPLRSPGWGARVHARSELLKLQCFNGACACGSVVWR